MKVPKTALSLLLALITLLPHTWALAAAPQEPTLPQAWEAVAPGIDFQLFHINNPRPVNIFVSRMDRANLDLTIDTGISNGNIASGIETVRSQAARYDEAINYWGSTWGNRNDVVVAINGYFFGNQPEPPNVELPEVPWSGIVNSGWYAKRFYETTADAGFAWKTDRTAHIGSCVIHPGSANFVNFVRGNYSPNINTINRAHDEEGTILYTPQWDSSTLTAASNDVPKAEILIEMTRPAMVLPTPAKAIGFVREIRLNQGSTPIPFDHVVLAAWGDDGLTMQDKIAAGLVAVGDEVHITQEISDCDNTPQHDWTKTYASLGGDYHFLNNGVVRTQFGNPDAAVRNARTAVAYNANYVYFVIVDGFHLNVSEGLNIVDLGNFLKNNPDILATDAVTMDSGGSSTMVINGEVVNNTECNFARNCGIDAPEGTMLPLEETYGIRWTDEAGMLEPLVGTSMMMVVVEPITRSLTFTATQPITTTALTEVRLGPGTNYAAFASVPAGSHGEVVAHGNHLDGVLAKGSYWWKVDIGDLLGWVKEEHLSGGQLPPGPPPPPTTGYSMYLPLVNRTNFAALNGAYLSSNPESPPAQPVEGQTAPGVDIEERK